jgi:hypothetical protein
MYERCRPETKAAMINFVDVFAGSDGCVDFFNLSCFIDDIDDKAQNGDDAAQQLIDVVLRFNRLIGVVQK